MAGKPLLYITIALLMTILSACENPFGSKKTNWEVSLRHDDKKPYGSYLAYKSLHHYFPGAEIEVLSQGFRYTSMDGQMYYDGNGNSLLILLGLDFQLSALELEELVYFANNGNEVMLLCSKMDETLENRLHFNKELGGLEEVKLRTLLNGRQNEHILSLNNKPGAATYGHHGRSLASYFTTETDEPFDMTGDNNVSLTSDSGIVVNFDSTWSDMAPGETETTDDDEDEIIIKGPDTLGFAAGKPDFIRYKIGAGHITLHAAPLVFSNYFLLQGNNKYYLDSIWHTLPDGISHVYWNAYYKRRANGSEFGVLWRYPATRWALIIALFTLLMYVLFESKRRQKIIPVIEQPENTSLSFTETVGRLYYNKGNHSNIAEKMIQHFLEWVRTNHYLNTNHLNYDFIQHLSKKTGETEQTVSRLVEMIHEIRIGSIQPDEPYLYELYTTIQRFYKNNEH